MKTPVTQLTLSIGLASLLAATLGSQAQTPLAQGHADVGIAFEDDAWDLHVHDHDNDIEYSPPTNALYVVKAEAHGFVPAGSPWSFLGAPGSEVWTLPKVQDPNLLFLGVGAEEIGANIFVGDAVALALKGIIGPGHFAMYDNDTFGAPIVRFNTGDGIGGTDVLSVPTGSHTHYNWAFSAPGDYRITFEANGTLVNGNVFTSSGDVDYLFHVEAVPEPGVMALLGMGAAALLIFRRRV